MAESGKRPYPGRLAVIIGLIALWSLLILARLVQLQVLKHAHYTQMATKGQIQNRSLLGPRGIIYDSHMDELASSVSVRTVAAEPRRIKNIPFAAEALASLLDMNRAELQARLSDPAKQVFQIVKRRVSPRAEAQIEKLDIEGVYQLEESMRVYPNLDLACHTLGFVNMNGDGGAGLELQFDRDLKGEAGLISFDVDAYGHSFRGKVQKQPVQGHSLVLSLDRSIQYIAAKALAAGVERARAVDGVAIVMETETGRILALASYPYFNCNTYNEYSADLWRNRAVSDLYEPGSTFKVVVAATALEAGLTRPTEMIDCQMGSITIGRHIFHDHKPYGLLTFSQILENSSNIGAAKLGLRLGEQRLYNGLRTFGFGAKTGVDLPGEIPGLVRDWRQWSGLSIGAISFGQEVGVTSVQILCAINAIANGGYLVSPYVVDRVINEKGDLLQEHRPDRKRILRPETAAAIRDAFEGVVLRGTGRKAALEGFRVAGKTGTAQKIVDGHYSNTKYLASFVGFAPLPDPRLTILVWIDEPKGQIYGGDISAPVFKEIAQESLLQLHVPPDPSMPLPKFNPALLAESTGDFLPNATPVVPVVSAEGGTPGAADAEDSITVLVEDQSVTVPDFHGMPKRRVIAYCRELGLQMQSTGSGIAVLQIPPPGTKVPVGEVCQVTFSRASAGIFEHIPGLAQNGTTMRSVGPPARAAATQH